ncbi:unnamed protein product [Nippostrongylus brasiliensis]|uniref:Innexin n=1 Tax=Nippostrongylus brasiliensis TaxID=27835 RepID=A0A0N4Y9J0_NIPBR|nr:unnamed protein product [Nippostrongylus brasiliensis]
MWPAYQYDRFLPDRYRSFQADRLNSRITVCLLALSSVLLMSSHFMGDPITCWVPAQFTKQWSDFVNQYCYVHGTYFVSLNESLPYNESERRKIPINYYQWVPYILAVQAFLFYMPRFVWKSLISFSGYDLAGAIQYVDGFWSTVKTNDATFKARIAAFEGRASAYIWDGLRLARNKSSRDMALYYTISTVIQSVNAWLQVSVSNRKKPWSGQIRVFDALVQCVHRKKRRPGFTNERAVSETPSAINPFDTASLRPFMIREEYHGNTWGNRFQVTGHFPRITHCDFNRRRPASVQLDTVLCVLTLNIYYEKLFIFLWFWLFFVAIVSTMNSVFWIVSLCATSKVYLPYFCNFFAILPFFISNTLP